MNLKKAMNFVVVFVNYLVIAASPLSLLNSDT